MSDSTAQFSVTVSSPGPQGPKGDTGATGDVTPEATAAKVAAQAAQAAAQSAQTAAETAAATATTKAAAASGSADTATAQAGIATTQAGTATSKAAVATAQADVATAQAGVATAQAGSAAGSASAASGSASAAITKASEAASSAASALDSKGQAAASEAAALVYRNDAEGFKSAAAASALAAHAAETAALAHEVTALQAAVDATAQAVSAADSARAAHGVPAGGATDDVLAKSSGTDYATTWRTLTTPTIRAPFVDLGVVNGPVTIDLSAAEEYALTIPYGGGAQPTFTGGPGSSATRTTKLRVTNAGGKASKSTRAASAYVAGGTAWVSYYSGGRAYWHNLQGYWFSTADGVSVTGGAWEQPPNCASFAGIYAIGSTLYATGYSTSSAALYVSTDHGATWVPRNAYYDTFSTIWGNGSTLVGFCAGGSYLGVSTDDGATWTQTTGGNTAVTAMAWSPTAQKWVAVYNSTTLVSVSSANSLTWTTTAHGMGVSPTSVVWAGDKFVLVGNTGKISTSPDGVTWTARTSGTTSNFVSVVYNGSYIVAYTSTGTSSKSTDGGATWAYSATANTGIKSPIWMPDAGIWYQGPLLTTGQSMKSVDGVTYTKTAPAIANLSTGKNYWQLGPNLHIQGDGASSLNGYSHAYSTDGETWQQSAGPVGNNMAVSSAFFVSGGGVHLALSTTNSYWSRSTDGLAWTQVGTKSGTWKHACWAGDRFFAITAGSAGLTGSGNNLFTSTDLGLTWTQVTTTPTVFAQGAVINCIAWDGTALLVGCNNWSMIFRSTDLGLTWTQVGRNYTLISSSVLCFLVGNGVIVAVLYGAAYVQVSADHGVTWTLFPIKSTATSYAGFLNGRFHLIGDAGYQSSADGMRWTSGVGATQATASIPTVLYPQNIGYAGGKIIYQSGNTHMIAIPEGGIGLRWPSNVKSAGGAGISATTPSPSTPSVTDLFQIVYDPAMDSYVVSSIALNLKG